jgi:geranyl-CoA carboxylase alpha subunit
MSAATRAATPFRKLLIANRGEIALRIMRSARASGYRTVGVYSTADAQARHALEADEAVCIGAASPADSYLNIPALIAAARRTGADAVHPGYGFLAENAAFATACREAGLVFVGPSPDAIATMGHKAGAKRLMKAAGVPCVPGYEGADQDPARLAEEAARIGYPVMIKAVAGGGGRGMRLVASAAGFAAELRSAQSEALHAFSDGTVILERAILRPRHVEIQILADGHGNAIHLGERDCSVQRRHQKLIEESPSPAVSAELREAMGDTAVAAVKAIGYEGAGTLEFLLDAEGRYYFMEMNTRLQVEHPVTEALTGLDLVALQLAIAAGEVLRLTQSDVHLSGHAIEVRLCAEDPGQSFMPQSGVVSLWQVPDTLRVEHALRSGAGIPAEYDSMIAKVVAHGATREAALRKLRAGLQDLVALGLRTNQAFLSRCLGLPAFAQGQATTAFIAEHAAELLEPDEAMAARAAALAAVLLLHTPADGGTPMPLPDRPLPMRLPIALRFELDGAARTAHITHQGAGRYQVAWPGASHEVDLIGLLPQQARMACDGIDQDLAFVREGPLLWLSLSGVPFLVKDTTRAAATPAGTGGASDGRLRASMNGRVVAVLVQVGDTVRAGQALLTLEAMKMEHSHTAPCAGIVQALHTAAGEQVPAGRVLAEIVPEVVS